MMHQFKANSILLISLLLASFLNKVDCCQDVEGGIDIGWKFQPTCQQIKKKYPKLCENKNVVKSKCQKSCNTCAFSAPEACADTKGKDLRMMNVVGKSHIES